MRKSFTDNMAEINYNIRSAERLLKETMSFYEDDDMGMEEMPMDDEMDMEDDIPAEEMTGSVDSYVDSIRKYALNGLSALCEDPESEEYQMLKKIFQMCDKKPEKKEGMTESKRLFGISKDNNQVLFETKINNPKDFKNLQRAIVTEARVRGVNPSSIRLVSENKIIR